MAEKRSGSIFSRLRGLRPAARREPEAAADATKRPEPPQSPDPQRPSTDSGVEAAHPGPDKKKKKPQPWYRHRKRW
jgi:hypothetical protein